MMPLKQMVGLRFGKTVVTERAANRGIATYWVCKCDCGNTHTSRGSALRRGLAKSCGCLRMGLPRHGMRNSREYKSWLAMKARCTNPNNKDYARYGGRGIVFCDSWLVFENFYADMGDRPARMTLDRIDNDGNYEPGNCRWATDVQQAANRRKPVQKEILQ